MKIFSTPHSKEYNEKAANILAHCCEYEHVELSLNPKDKNCATHNIAFELIREGFLVVLSKSDEYIEYSITIKGMNLFADEDMNFWEYY